MLGKDQERRIDCIGPFGKPERDFEEQHNIEAVVPVVVVLEAVVLEGVDLALDKGIFVEFDYQSYSQFVVVFPFV